MKRFILLILLAGASVAQQPAATQAQRDRDQSRSGPQQKDNKAEEKYYQRWLDEDVRWIITDEERAAFKKLSTPADRDEFIEAFWQRRDPAPGAAENEYKLEHYRRIAYANEHFSGGGVPGWRTDRGRLYIAYGKPDSIDAHPAGGPYQRTAEEGGGTTVTYPFEVWRYRHIDGLGENIEIEFVDECGCGEYHIALDRSEKDALPHPPNAGLTDTKQTKAERFSQLQLPRPQAVQQPNQFVKPNRALEVRFKDLEAVVNTKIRYNLLPFDVRVDFVRVTADTVLVPVTVQVPNRELTFVNRDGVQRGVVNIFGRLMTLTGKVAQTFEDTRRLDFPAELFDKLIGNVALYWKAVLLRPGRYRLDIVIKDVNGDKLGAFGQGILVPDFSEDRLASSTLILADVLERVPSREIGTRDFVLGANKVRPRVARASGEPATFKRDQKINFWMQVYNLVVDEKTKQPSATVEYQVVNTATGKSVVDVTESTDQMGNSGDQMTLARSLPLNTLEPGIYQVTIKVIDLISKQTISPTARFSVE